MLFRSDRKSTRLNSSHLVISYAVFCLKKKKNFATRVSPPPLSAAVRYFQPAQRAGTHKTNVRGGGAGSGKKVGKQYFFFLMIGRPPRSPLFPYTTLSR